MKATVSVAFAAGSVIALSSALAGPPQVQRIPRIPFRVANSATDTLPYADNFDSYATGAFPCASAAPNCVGPNDWHLWAAAEASRSGPAGPNNGAIASGTAHSGANALRFTQMTDVVQPGNLTSGAYDIRVWTYVPSSVPTGTYTQNWIIVLNQYEPPYLGGNGLTGPSR